MHLCLPLDLLFALRVYSWLMNDPNRDQSSTRLTNRRMSLVSQESSRLSTSTLSLLRNQFSFLTSVSFFLWNHFMVVAFNCPSLYRACDCLSLLFILCLIFHWTLAVGFIYLSQNQKLLLGILLSQFSQEKNEKRTEKEVGGTQNEIWYIFAGYEVYFLIINVFAISTFSCSTISLCFICNDFLSHPLLENQDELHLSFKCLLIIMAIFVVLHSEWKSVTWGIRHTQSVVKLCSWIQCAKKRWVCLSKWSINVSLFSLLFSSRVDRLLIH